MGVSYFFDSFKISIVCVCTHKHTHNYRCLWRPEEGVIAFGIGVIGRCELPSDGVGNWFWVPCKSSRCS